MNVYVGEAIEGAAAVCWLCWWIVTPRSVWPGLEAAMAAYARLLGRQRTLLALALALTLLSGLVSALSRPAPIDPDLEVLRFAHATCASVRIRAYRPICIELAPGDVWVAQELGDDGRWRVVAILERRPPINALMPEDCIVTLAPGNC